MLSVCGEKDLVLRFPKEVILYMTCEMFSAKWLLTTKKFYVFSYLTTVVLSLLAFKLL